MIKPLNKNDVQNTPFIATKEWQLTNVENTNLLLLEHSGSTAALEFLDYDINATSSFENTFCSICLEQQDNDLINFREGQKSSGLFFEESEPTNLDGTYKRLVHTQIKEMFYNNHRDPTKMWGLENIDFEKSQTKKFISDKFRLYEIPVSIFGEKVVENSISMTDASTDNNYTITDDGYGNLYAGPNLFSKQQEIGSFTNQFSVGVSSACNAYL